MTSHDDGHPAALPGDHGEQHRGLKTGALGLAGVLFMSVANAAPITAMSFNVPIGLGYGNGIGVSGGYFFAMIVLCIFTIGFAAMGRHITTTGAFYGFISHGLGQKWGMAMGLLATVSYIMFEGALIGGCAYFATDSLARFFSINVSWLMMALLFMAVIWVLTYFDVRLTSAILGVTLIAEVVLLLSLAATVMFQGGPDGYLINDTVNPLAAFRSLPEGAFGSGVAAGTAAIGIFFAFWSWIGYETVAVYGEESRNPRRNVPLGLIIAVIGLGLFYTLLSWTAVVGNGAKVAVETAAGTSPVDLWLTLAQDRLGTWAVDLWSFLLVMGSFACAMAFHNAGARYIYALGREAPTKSIRDTVGSTHPAHQSPVWGSTIQTLLNVLIVLYYAFFTSVEVDGEKVDLLIPYVNIYGIPSLVGTAMILIVQTFTAIAVIWFFWVKKVHKGNVLTTFVAPLLGAGGMIYALTLLFQNLAFAGGLGGDEISFKLLPWYVVVTLVWGFGYAIWLQRKRPDVYAEVGRTVLEEAHERA